MAFSARRAGKISWNRDAFEQIRRSSEVDRLLQEVVNGIAERLPDLGEGEHYDGGVESGASRSRAYVVTTSGEAVREEADTHALLRALAAGAMYV